MLKRVEMVAWLRGCAKIMQTEQNFRLCNEIAAFLETNAARPERQAAVRDWCRAAFGADHATSLPQRGLRLAEEAIEAAQACGTPSEKLHRLVDYVYDRPAGQLGQELGGIGVTLLALAAAAKLDADQEEAREVARVLAKPLAHFAERNRQKNEAGFDVVTNEQEEGNA